MNPQLTQVVAQSRQQELLRVAEQRRLACELTRRPSLLARFTSSIASLSFTRRRSAELRQPAPATVDA
jgi:hypothetical protein